MNAAEKLRLYCYTLDAVRLLNNIPALPKSSKNLQLRLKTPPGILRQRLAIRARPDRASQAGPANGINSGANGERALPNSSRVRG